MRFEKKAHEFKWSCERWMALVANILQGKALEVYDSMTSVEEYEEFTRLILTAYKLRPETYRLMFKNAQKRLADTYLSYAQYLRDALNKLVWNEAVETVEDMKELILLEHFSNNAERDIAINLRERRFQTLKEAATWADDRVLAQRGSAGHIQPRCPKWKLTVTPKTVQLVKGSEVQDLSENSSSVIEGDTSRVAFEEYHDLVPVTLRYPLVEATAEVAIVDELPVKGEDFLLGCDLVGNTSFPSCGSHCSYVGEGLEEYTVCAYEQGAESGREVMHPDQLTCVGPDELRRAKQEDKRLQKIFDQVGEENGSGDSGELISSVMVVGTTVPETLEAASEEEEFYHSSQDIITTVACAGNKDVTLRERLNHLTPDRREELASQLLIKVP
ncbi:hypothetical protein Pcinc_007788 [Petrolisthes cinctipes]|uniref:Uncharacterized protein n=1 Tax=Petrolisthes cinctipes TaxID=88211 RepID=A0AAE1KXV6_PETCI|nr:hypothetical protein Pcinc_007788 [Petrolisthes cinctipes]